MVYIPPALMLLGIAGLGALAGVLGFVFAAPMMVAIFVVVEKAYVRDTLKEDVSLPGKRNLTILDARFSEGASIFVPATKCAFPSTGGGLYSVRRQRL